MQGSTLSFLVNFTFEYSIRKVQENQEGLKLDGTHRLLQVLAYTDNVNSLVENKDTVKK
jgi:hypothetical protein